MVFGHNKLVDPNPSLAPSARLRKLDRDRSPDVFLGLARAWIAQAAAGVRRVHLPAPTSGCRWIEGDLRSATAAFCGDPREGEGSWCAAHRARVFVSAAKEKM
jgi:hypothetical protein